MLKMSSKYIVYHRQVLTIVLTINLTTKYYVCTGPAIPKLGRCVIESAAWMLFNKAVDRTWELD